MIEAIYKVIEEVQNEIDAGQVEQSLDRKIDLMTGSIINRMIFSKDFYGVNKGYLLPKISYKFQKIKSKAKFSEFKIN